MSDIKLEFGKQSPDAPPASLEKAADKYDITSLTAQEQNTVKNFVKQINIEDNNAVITYGAPAQKKIADFSDNILKNVRTKDTGEAGKMLSNLMSEIQNFDASGQEKKGLKALFGGAKKSMDRVVASYSSVEANVVKITDALEGHRRQMLKDIALYDTMFENNYNYFKELNMYIIAGKEKLKEIEKSVIPQLRKKAETSQDELDAQRLNDMLNAVNRFEKKIHDLELSRMISLQMAPQIRLVQNNDAQLADKIQSSIVNAIPLWKNQMVISLGLANSNAALAAQRQVSATINETLKKNSEMLKQGSIDIATETEKGIVEIETIQKTNQDLIETIKTVLEIQQKGSEERKAAEVALNKMEGELKQALIEAKRQ